MKRVSLAFGLMAIVLSILGCSGRDDCMDACVSPQRSEGWCRMAPTKAGGCKDAFDAPTGEAGQALTPTLSARWTITNQAASGTATACNDPSSSLWCKCGTNYTDAGVSCVQQGATMIFEYPTPGAPVAPGARFRVDTTASTYANSGPLTVKLYVLTRPVTRPTMGQAGYCATTSQASWYRAGATAWEVPGAKGASDRTAVSATRVDAAGNVLPDTFAAHDSVVTERWDVSTILNACPATGSCFLALEMDAGVHLNAQGGTAVLSYELAGPPPECGDGVLAGSEACDDGNITSGDGCTALCTIEPGWHCAGTPSTCSTTCGDGIVAGAEQCDDGNTSSADACSATCITQVCTCQ